ncbi:MAG: DUF5069 domain-containing protein [Candidatus Eremiobacteraeota bacterium]|nr:DUF5069 domain-containing protein [Candidatus Eremiobacteraeota bacterium]
MSTSATPSQKVVPVLSSDTAGPLGAIHLPRLWLKLSLASAGLLPPDYDECGSGFDQMTLSDLGLDRQKTMDYVRTHRPRYMQFEEWVLEQNGGSISPDRIEKHNAAVRGYNHDDEKAAKMRDASGIKNVDVLDAVTLNTIEDLDDIYEQIPRK